MTRNKRLIRFIVAVACVALLISLLIFAQAVLAEWTITINAPSAGSAIGAGPFSISVSFNMDTPDNYMVYASWYDTSIGGGGQSFQQEVTGSSGSVSFDADAAGYPSGRYRVLASIVRAGDIPAASVLASTQMDFFIEAGGVVAPTPTPTGTTPGGSGVAGTIGIVAAVTVVGGGAVWLLRKMFGGAKKTPVKTAPAPKITYKEAETVEQAAARLAAVKRNGELMDRYHQLRKIVMNNNDYRLLDFVDNARDNIIGKDGIVNEANLARLESNLKSWIRRDTLGEKMPEYGGTDVMIDLLKAPVTGWTGMFVRGAAGFMSAGYSEMVFNPLSTILTVRDSINQNKSGLRVAWDGVWNSGTSLALGESGRLVKYAKPYYEAWQKGRAISRLAEANPDIAHDLSNIEQLAKQGYTSRNAFMNGSEVVRVGETSAAELSHAEKLAVELNNNAAARKWLMENSHLMSKEVKEVFGAAKQKVYETARNAAIQDTLEQMAKDGVKPEGPLFVQQTGTHARPGNPGWNSLKSDFDHTVDFGSAERNAFYESRFNSHLEGQGTNAAAIDANVYGAGTSARGAYSGGAMKFVENYNQASGSQVMVRVKDGVTTISREEPQAIDSLFSTMKPEDIASARGNYQEFFNKALEKGNPLDTTLKNVSKEVSRTARLDVVKNFQQTGRVSNFEMHPAAKVATLVKEKGMSLGDAMQKAGYSGSKTQLLSDYKKIMGI